MISRQKILKTNWNRISEISGAFKPTEKQKFELNCRVKAQNNFANGEKEEALELMHKISKDVGVYDE